MSFLKWMSIAVVIVFLSVAGSFQLMRKYEQKASRHEEKNFRIGNDRFEAIARYYCSKFMPIVGYSGKKERVYQAVWKEDTNEGILWIRLQEDNESFAIRRNGKPYKFGNLAKMDDGGYYVAEDVRPQKKDD